MAEIITATGDYGIYYYVDSDSVRDVLTQDQQDANAWYICRYVQANNSNWSINAVAAMCGNFAHEGVMNPAQWQYGFGKDENDGYGLGQWTPATKLFNFLSGTPWSRTTIDGQIAMVANEAATGQQWIPTSAYPLSMNDFLVSTDSVEYLASAWLYDWERPADPAATESDRRKSATYYYTLLTGEEPPDPGPGPGPGPDPGPEEKARRLKPCFYHRHRYD